MFIKKLIFFNLIIMKDQLSQLVSVITNIIEKRLLPGNNSEHNLEKLYNNANDLINKMIDSDINLFDELSKEKVDTVLDVIFNKSNFAAFSWLNKLNYEVVSYKLYYLSDEIIIAFMETTEINLPGIRCGLIKRYAKEQKFIMFEKMFTCKEIEVEIIENFYESVIKPFSGISISSDIICEFVFYRMFPMFVIASCYDFEHKEANAELLIHTMNEAGIEYSLKNWFGLYDIVPHLLDLDTILMTMCRQYVYYGKNVYEKKCILRFVEVSNFGDDLIHVLSYLSRIEEYNLMNAIYELKQETLERLEFLFKCPNYPKDIKLDYCFER